MQVELTKHHKALGLLDLVEQRLDNLTRTKLESISFHSPWLRIRCESSRVAEDPSTVFHSSHTSETLLDDPDLLFNVEQIDGKVLLKIELLLWSTQFNDMLEE